MECYGRAQGNSCIQPSLYLDHLEVQLEAYFETFTISEDYQRRILTYYGSMNHCGDVRMHQDHLKARLERLQELYTWGDISREVYLQEKCEVQTEIRTLEPDSHNGGELTRLAGFLRDIRGAWANAFPQQKNRLARALFEGIWVT